MKGVAVSEVPGREPVLWITGLAGAGKTATASRVVAALRRDGQAVVHLDGDAFRSIMGNDLGHDPKDRLANAERIARTCAFLQSQGVLVVCSTMSLYPDIWGWNRTNLSPYLQVYLRVAPSVLHARDKKGLYSGASLGQQAHVVGHDLPFHEPLDSDLILENDQLDDLPRNVGRILEALAGQAARRSDMRSNR